MRDKIKLEKCVCKGNRITYYFSSTLGLFKRRKFFVEYDRDIDEKAESIHSIPFAAAMAPVCWAAGADLEVFCLDRRYAQSLALIQDQYRKWFRKWSFAGRLTVRCKGAHAGLLPQPGSKSGILFSSGLDSLTSYVHHREERPALFSVFGADIPLRNPEFIALCKRKFEEFARAQGVDLFCIYTNVREVFDDGALKRYTANWYGDVAHGLMLTALVAPVSCHSLQNLYLASCTHGINSRHPCGSEFHVIQNIRWGHTAVQIDNSGLSRSQKIARFLKGQEAVYPYLRVCWRQFRTFNCSQCEKCLRTMCDLLLNNIDPARCNFDIGESTLPELRRQIENRYYFFFRDEGTLDFWRSIQRDVDLGALEDRYGAREFFAWLVGYERLKGKHNSLIASSVTAWLQARSALARAKAALLSCALALGQRRSSAA